MKTRGFRPQTSEGEFTRQMAERFRSALPDRTVEIIGPLQLRISLAPDAAEIDVWRIFNYCASASAAECEASIDHFVASQAEGIESLGVPIACEQLRVAVRNAEFCRAIHGDRTPRPEEPATRRFLAGLCTVIVADFPNRTRSLSADQLGEMGLALEAAWTLAERQTLAGLPRPEAIEGLEDKAVMLTDLRYLPSLLLDTNGWRAARERHGDLLVAVPESHAMVVARADRVDDPAALKAAVRDHFETAERGVSPTIFRFGPSGWVPVD